MGQARLGAELVNHLEPRGNGGGPCGWGEALKDRELEVRTAARGAPGAEVGRGLCFRRRRGGSREPETADGRGGRLRGSRDLPAR